MSERFGDFDELCGEWTVGPPAPGWRSHPRRRRWESPAPVPRVLVCSIFYPSHVIHLSNIPIYLSIFYLSKYTNLPPHSYVHAAAAAAAAAASLNA